jgi:hypothetical protein
VRLNEEFPSAKFCIDACPSLPDLNAIMRYDWYLCVTRGRIVNVAAFDLQQWQFLESGSAENMERPDPNITTCTHKKYATYSNEEKTPRYYIQISG